MQVACHVGKASWAQERTAAGQTRPRMPRLAHTARRPLTSMGPEGSAECRVPGTACICRGKGASSGCECLDHEGVRQAAGANMRAGRSVPHPRLSAEPCADPRSQREGPEHQRLVQTCRDERRRRMCWRAGRHSRRAESRARPESATAAASSAPRAPAETREGGEG